MTEEIKRIDIKEFREKGFLQEVNRQFFHPIGLALEVLIDEEGYESLGGVLDYRDDPEGFFFPNEVLSEEKIKHVAELKASKIETRVAAGQGYGTPVDSNGFQIKRSQSKEKSAEIKELKNHIQSGFNDVVIRSTITKDTSPAITISNKRYEELVEAEELLNVLSAVGVDNWDGYKDAIEMLEE